jgi:hypothetical protein
LKVAGNLKSFSSGEKVACGSKPDEGRDVRTIQQAKNMLTRDEYLAYFFRCAVVSLWFYLSLASD